MKKLSLIAFILSSLLFSGASTAKVENTYFCDDKLGDTPIRQGGRVKPLYVHTIDMMKYLTGKKKYENLSSIEAYCLLSLRGMDLKSDIDLKARVDHVDAQEFFDLSEDVKTISFDTLVENMRDIQIETRSIKEENAYKKSLTKLLNQASLYQEII